MSAILEIRDICFSYGKAPVLKDVSFCLQRGEVLAIIGPSGGGKSTLLRAVALLVHPDSGEIVFHGQPVYSSKRRVPKASAHKYRAHVGIVFQELHLWPHLTVAQNIVLPLVRGRDLPQGEAGRKAAALLRTLSLGELADRRPPELSVGQQQRCAIARTLAMDPDVLLLDEITSALDPELVESILSLVRDIAIDPNRTLLVVTHSMDFARRVSDRIAYLDRGTLSSPAEAAEDPPDGLSNWLGKTD